MITKEQIEGNKLIAEFMDIPKCGRCKDCGAYQYGPAVIYYPKDMKYHNSWDWLMPCLKLARQRIKESGFDVATEKLAKARLNAAFNEVCNVDIENAHFCFVKFIEWYKEQLSITP